MHLLIISDIKIYFTLVPEAFFEYYLFLFGNLPLEVLIEAPGELSALRANKKIKKSGSRRKTCQ